MPRWSLSKKIHALTMRAMPLMLTCRELDRFIVDYLDGSLSPGLRRKFDLHLRLCRECRRYVEGYRRTIELSRAVLRDPDALVPDEVPHALVAAITSIRSDST